MNIDFLKPYLIDQINNETVLFDHFSKNQVDSILEIGVSKLYEDAHLDIYGQSFKILYSLASLFNSSIYISIDRDDCNSTISHSKTILNSLDIYFDNHCFIQSDSLKFETSQKFDLIFLDSSHDADGGFAGHTYQEIHKYSSLLNKNGSIFIHDTLHNYISQDWGNNVWGAIQRFLSENAHWKFIEHRANRFGLGQLYATN